MPEQWNPLRLTAEDRFPAPLAAVLLILYCSATLYVGLHHEPWRDEADAWLAARDLPLSEMVTGWTAHAGQPVLWYLVLKPLVRLGLPYAAQTVVNLIFMWAAAAVFLFAAPLTRLMKVLFLASYFMAYEYSVIARSYGLSILLIFLAAATYRSRDRHPIRFAIVVALLFSANIYGAIIAGLFLLIFAIPPRRTRPALAAIAIMVAGAVVAYLQLRLPAVESNPLAMRSIQPSAAITAMRDAFLPAATSPGMPIVGLLIIVCVALSIRTSARALLLFAGSIVALLTLYAVVWFGGLRASGFILIVVITSIWIAGQASTGLPGRIAAGALNATLILSAAFAVSVAKTDIAFAFSGSKEMAAFIDHRFDNSDIAAYRFYETEALLPYLPGRRFWYIGLGEYGTYLKWDATMRRGGELRYDIAVLMAREHFAQTAKPWLLLLNTRMPEPERYGFRLIHATSVVVFRNLDERYWLYEPIR
jgi:hypothetical protein